MFRCLGFRVQVFGSLGLWVFGSLGLWVLGFSCLGFRCFGFRRFGFLVFGCFQGLGFRVFRV